jgi:hypothetical protein
MDGLGVIEQSVESTLDGGLAFVTVLFACELEAQPPQRHWAIEVVVSGQALAAVDNVVTSMS